jgi:hypothetical protein
MTALLRGDRPCSTLADYGAISIDVPSDEPPPTLALTLATNAAVDGFVAVGNSYLGGLRSSGTGSEVFQGSGASKLGTLRSSGTGSEVFQGSGASKLGTLRSSGTGAETFSGTGASKLGTLRSSGTGAETFSGTGASKLGTLRSSGTGAEVFQGSGASKLGTLRSSGTGTETFQGSGASKLETLRSSGTGADVFQGSGASKLGELISSGLGTSIGPSPPAPSPPAHLFFSGPGGGGTGLDQLELLDRIPRQILAGMRAPEQIFEAELDERAAWWVEERGAQRPEIHLHVHLAAPVRQAEPVKKRDSRQGLFVLGAMTMFLGVALGMASKR